MGKHATTILRDELKKTPYYKNAVRLQELINGKIIPAHIQEQLANVRKDYKTEIMAVRAEFMEKEINVLEKWLQTQNLPTN